MKILGWTILNAFVLGAWFMAIFLTLSGYVPFTWILPIGSLITLVAFILSTSQLNKKQEEQNV